MNPDWTEEPGSIGETALGAISIQDPREGDEVALGVGDALREVRESRDRLRRALWEIKALAMDAILGMEEHGLNASQVHHIIDGVMGDLLEGEDESPGAGQDEKS